MKEIKAIIPPKRLERIRDAFRGFPGFPGMNITQIRGCSEHSGVELPSSARAELTEFSEKIRIEMVVPDELVDGVVRLIHQHAHTGQTGDGVLWVTEVQQFYRLCKPLPD